MTDVRLSADLSEITADIFTSTSAIIGIRGSGKTNDGVVLVEQAGLYGVPFGVIDPTGVWWGLKSSADGEHAGLPVYVFGGQHGDVPLEEASGAIVARFLVDQRVPIVLDLSLLRKGAQRRFVADFAERLYDLKATTREPLLVVIDEAARFIPQQIRQGEADLARCVGAVEDIVALGRSRGLGCALIGQRPATINKNVLTQADNLFAMRTVGTQDRKALDEWVTEAQGDQKQRDEMVQNIASLAQGEGYFWSPALFSVFRRVKFAARKTFDSSRTPKIGETRFEPTAFASVDLEALRGEIAASVERAKNDDPKALRAHIAELEKQLRVRPQVNAEPERVEVPVEIFVLPDTVAVELRSIVTDTEDLWNRFEDEARSLTDRFEQASGVISDALVRFRGAMERRPAPRAIVTANAASHAEIRTKAAPTDSTAAKVSGGERKILEALAIRYPETSTKKQIAVLSGYTASGGGYRNYLGALRSKGLIDYVDSETLRLTEDGAAIVADAVAVRRDPSELIELWASKLGTEAKLLRVIAAAYPSAISKDELAAQTGYTASGGGFRNYLGALRSAGLIEYRGTTVRASDDLFVDGR